MPLPFGLVRSRLALVPLVPEKHLRTPLETTFSSLHRLRMAWNPDSQRPLLLWFPDGGEHDAPRLVSGEAGVRVQPVPVGFAVTHAQDCFWTFQLHVAPLAVLDRASPWWDSSREPRFLTLDPGPKHSTWLQVSAGDGANRARLCSSRHVFKAASFRDAVLLAQEFALPSSSSSSLSHRVCVLIPASAAATEAVAAGTAVSVRPVRIRPAQRQDVANLYCRHVPTIRHAVRWLAPHAAPSSSAPTRTYWVSARSCSDVDAFLDVLPHGLRVLPAFPPIALLHHLKQETSALVAVGPLSPHHVLLPCWSARGLVVQDAPPPRTVAAASATVVDPATWAKLTAGTAFPHRQLRARIKMRYVAEDKAVPCGVAVVAIAAALPPRCRWMVRPCRQGVVRTTVRFVVFTSRNRAAVLRHLQRPHVMRNASALLLIGPDEPATDALAAAAAASSATFATATVRPVLPCPFANRFRVLPFLDFKGMPLSMRQADRGWLLAHGDGTAGFVGMLSHVASPKPGSSAVRFSQVPSSWNLFLRKHPDVLSWPCAPYRPVVWARLPASTAFVAAGATTAPATTWLFETLNGEHVASAAAAAAAEKALACRNTGQHHIIPMHRDNWDTVHRAVARQRTAEFFLLAVPRRWVATAAHAQYASAHARFAWTSAGMLDSAVLSSLLLCSREKHSRVHLVRWLRLPDAPGECQAMWLTSGSHDGERLACAWDRAWNVVQHSALEAVVFVVSAVQAAALLAHMHAFLQRHAWPGIARCVELHYVLPAYSSPPPASLVSRSSSSRS